MTFATLAAITISCVVLSPTWEACVQNRVGADSSQVAGIASSTPSQGPRFTGTSLDVVLTAQAVLVWDVGTGNVLYEKNASLRRPVASLTKLASVIVLRDRLPLEQMTAIPAEAARAQRQGAHIRLPVGQHARVKDLIAASLIPSANDAMVSLAVAAAGTEALFVEEANRALYNFGILNTKLSNSTGLSGAEQYSTAGDVRLMLTRLMADPEVEPYLSARSGVLTTQEGVRRQYVTTNELLGTYVPVLAAKTGYTREAGQNLALITQTADGHKIGAVVLGSDERFQDMKGLVGWIERNYTW